MRPFLAGLFLFVSVSSSGPARAEETQWLQYDAAIVHDEGLPAMGVYVMFIRYHVDAERIAGEVIHHEPGWNSSDFVWRLRGMAFYSDDSRLTVVNTHIDAMSEVEKPVGERPPASATGHSVESLAHSEIEMLARMEAFRASLLSGEGDDEYGPVEIDRDESGRIQRASWRLPTAEGTHSNARYRYGNGGGLEEITVDSEPVQVSATGTFEVIDGSGRVTRHMPRAIYHEGGRETRIAFEDFIIGNDTMRMPVHIEVRRRDNGEFVRSARHGNYMVRTLGEGQAPPWETWENARLSRAEIDRLTLVTSEGHSFGRTKPNMVHKAFYQTFLIPFDEIERDHSEVGFRLRAFFNAYNAALALGDQDYLTEGFPWYLEQIASIESPRLLFQAGQECIRLLLRWGYEDIAESCFRDWRAAAHALEWDETEDAFVAYAQLGRVYYAYRLFETDDSSTLTTQQRFRLQYWRCWTLQRLGGHTIREQLAPQARAHPSWATLTADEWTEMVVEEFSTAKDLFLAIENPSREEQRMMDALESFYIAAMEGRGFVEAGPSTAAPVSSGR